MSKPINFILKCFNALDPAVSNDPTQILNNLKNYVVKPINEDQVISSSAAGTFKSNYYQDDSSQSSYTSAAKSLGLKGSFGFYSGSSQVNHEKESYTSSNTFNSNFTSAISWGKLSFYQNSNYPAITALLDPRMIAQLNAINSLEDAENFTKEFGTHIILEVSLGGNLTIVIRIESSSFTEKESLSIEVKAAYSGLASIEAAAKASSTIEKKGTTGSVSQKMFTLGGNPTIAAHINPDNPQTMVDWADSCTEETVSGLYNALEIWNLATNSTAKDMLKTYLNLCILKHSIENPVVFSNYLFDKKYEYNSVTATVEEGYKIISGGAMTTLGKNDFLTSSCPTFDSEKNIIGWKAESHDCMNTSDNTNVVAFAVGVYDPANILEISVAAAEGKGNNKSLTASVRITDGFVLTGGGVETSNTQEFARYITSCYPSTQQSSFDSWTANVHDYRNASSANLITWAVGMAVRNNYAPFQIELSHSVIESRGGLQSHGDVFALLGNNQKIAGGGMKVDKIERNLAQGTYPSSQNGVSGWKEYNTDLNGEYEKSNSSAYAITLHMDCKLSNVTLKPYVFS